MYKVLIVDDERLIRITLKNMVDWKAMDCEVIAVAKDGEEALQIYEDIQPEIVITDLKMPGMDGIELITKIKLINKNTQVIALSNYSDYEYVRDAMKAGAFDYLLKVTLEPNDLESIIMQVKECCIESSISYHEENESAMKELQRCLILKKNNHEVKPEAFEKILASPLYKPYCDYYQMAYFRIDNINYLYKGKIKDHEQLQHHVQDLMRESIPLSMSYIPVFISNHSGIVLFQSTQKLRVLNICNSMIRNISQYMDIHMSITLSDVVTSLQDFYQTFDQLLKAHDIRFYEGEGSLIQIEKQQVFNILNMNDIRFHLEIFAAVSQHNFEKAQQQFHEAIEYMVENYIQPDLVLEYFIFIFNNIEGNEIARGTRHAIAFDKIAAQIRICETMNRLTDVLQDSLIVIQEWLKDSTTVKYRKEIVNIMQYVEDNINTKLTLKLIADEFHMNESSLSRTFKNETGSNLMYYINKQKMKKALELLRNDNLMIKDVAIAVGIEDQLYFNRVFKKYYDISPSEFKKKQVKTLE